MILEGEIATYEYIIQSDGKVIVNGTIQSTDNDNNICTLFFYLDEELAIKYYRQLDKNIKVIFDGKLDYKKWIDSNDTQRARYTLYVKKIQILNISNKTTLLYSTTEKRFIR